MADVPLVIEKVPEDLELKREVFAQIDQLARRHTCIATNSSSLLGTLIADGTARPDKIFNVRFAGPT